MNDSQTITEKSREECDVVAFLPTYNTVIVQQSFNSMRSKVIKHKKQCGLLLSRTRTASTCTATIAAR